MALFAISTLIPWIHRFIADEVWGECFWNEFSTLWYFSGFLGYLVMAHYIRYHLDWTRRRKILTGSACFIAGASFTAWSFWIKGVPGQLIATPEIEWSWGFCSPNVVLATFGIFLLFSCIEREKAPSAVTAIAKDTFGMYLMHMLFLVPVSGWIIGPDVSSPLLPVWLAIPVIALLTFTLSAVTTHLVSRIPGSRWLIG